MMEDYEKYLKETLGLPDNVEVEIVNFSFIGEEEERELTDKESFRQQAEYSLDIQTKIIQDKDLYRLLMDHALDTRNKELFLVLANKV